MKRRHLLAAAGGALIAAPCLVSAQPAWPTKGPVRLIAQFPPGGLVDTVSRLMAPHLSQALGQTVIVENKAGAGGLIGTDYVSRQPADGYALLVSHASVHIYAAATRNVMPFDPVSDFSHLAMLVEAPMVILVRKDSAFQTLGQYIAAAKVKPVRYGTSGIGSANHLYGELLKIEGSAPQHDHVPYQGSAPAMQDLLSGQIDSLFDPITTNVAQLKSGSLRALAVSTPQRLTALPNIPTFAELGFSSMTGSQWLGLSARGHEEVRQVDRQKRVGFAGGELDCQVVNFARAAQGGHAGCRDTHLAGVKMRRVFVQHFSHIPNHRIRIQRGTVMEFHTGSQLEDPFGFVFRIHRPAGCQARDEHTGSIGFGQVPVGQGVIHGDPRKTVALEALIGLSQCSGNICCGHGNAKHFFLGHRRLNHSQSHCSDRRQLTPLRFGTAGKLRNKFHLDSPLIS